MAVAEDAERPGASGVIATLPFFQTVVAELHPELAVIGGAARLGER